MSSSSAGSDTVIQAPANRVLRQFRIVFNAVKSHFYQVERETGIGGAQLWALSVVECRPGIGVTELSRELDIHQSTASYLVRSLVERGLLAAARDRQDRRSVGLHVQPVGQDLLRAAPAPFTGLLPNALSSLEAETLERLELDLAKLIALLAADNESARILLAQQMQSTHLAHEGLSSDRIKLSSSGQVRSEQDET